MKKNYLKPETIEVEVAMNSHLMDASLSGQDATTNSNGDYNTLSRDYDNWDE